MKECHGCVHWAGGDTAYMAPCTNPDAAGSRTAFDHSCVLHTPRIEPVVVSSCVQCPKCGAADLSYMLTGYMLWCYTCKSCKHTWG